MHNPSTATGNPGGLQTAFGNTSGLLPLFPSPRPQKGHPPTSPGTPGPAPSVPAAGQAAELAALRAAAGPSAGAGRAPYKARSHRHRAGGGRGGGHAGEAHPEPPRRLRGTAAGTAPAPPPGAVRGPGPPRPAAVCLPLGCQAAGSGTRPRWERKASAGLPGRRQPRLTRRRRSARSRERRRAASPRLALSPPGSRRVPGSRAAPLPAAPPTAARGRRAGTRARGEETAPSRLRRGVATGQGEMPGCRVLSLHSPPRPSSSTHTRGACAAVAAVGSTESACGVGVSVRLCARTPPTAHTGAGVALRLCRPAPSVPCGVTAQRLCVYMFGRALRTRLSKTFCFLS